MIFVIEYAIFVYGGIGMYAEILKIIEAGITNDRQKTINYSRKLADYCLENGQKNVSQKIIKLIGERNNNLT